MNAPTESKPKLTAKVYDLRPILERKKEVARIVKALKSGIKPVAESEGGAA